MIAKNAYEKYQHDSVFTATPGELTLMLYNGAIKFIMQGEQYISQKDYESANNAIIKAQNIINELSHTLDMRYEISNNFKTLYEYILSKLIEGNMKKDTDCLKEALHLVTEFRNTWQQAMKIARMQEAKAGTNA